MGFYRRYILPWLIHAGMGNTQLAPLRSGMIQAAHGRVLEIGIGSGLNIPFYGRNVMQVIGVDPSRTLLNQARQTAVWSRCPVRLLEAQYGALPLASRSMDCVVMTFTLCHVIDPIGALGEIRRVLKPGGELLFVELGRASDDQPRVQFWQEQVSPFLSHLAGNCHLDRRIDQLLRATGFGLDSLDAGYLVEGPKIMTYCYRGRASILETFEPLSIGLVEKTVP